MPPPVLINLDDVDLTRVEFDQEVVYTRLPQAHEFQLLGGVCAINRRERSIVAFADVGSDAWWVRGHVPGRPLLPGVLMLEMAAQASAFLAKMLIGGESFIAFGGVDDCKFRDTVAPPARLYILGIVQELRPRRFSTVTQGVCDGRMIFEATITGLAFRE